MELSERYAVGGGGNSANPSVVNVLRVLDFELFRKLIKTSCPPLAGGEFAYGRSKTSPDSERPTSGVRKLGGTNSETQIVPPTEDTFIASWSRQQIECIVVKQLARNSESVEQIQDRPKSLISRRGKMNSHTERERSISKKYLELFNNINTPFLEKNFSRFTEPSRGMSEAKVEQTSTETLSFRCVCERCRLMRGDVNNKSRKVVFTIAEGATHVAHSDNSRKVAFTLAEVLITLGIIGVVAAMTISVYVQKYTEKITVTRLEKSYSILSQAFEQAVNENGTVDNWCEREDVNTTSYLPCGEKLASKIKPYLKIVKSCKAEEKGCFDKLYKTRFEKNYYPTYNHSQQFVLSDGITISFSAINGDNYASLWCGANKNETNAIIRYIKNCGELYVDINGNSSPNVLGRDLFTFRIYKDGIAPSGLPSDTVWVTSFEDTCIKGKFYQRDTCAGWVLVNKNLDYLDCEDLSWKGKHTCKEK